MRAYDDRVKADLEEAKHHPSRPDYVIIPAAGSLCGPMPGITDNPDVANRIVERILKEHGARS